MTVRQFMSQHLIQKFFGLTRANKQIILMCLDATVCVLALYLAVCLRLGTFYELRISFVYGAIVSCVFCLSSFHFFDVYRHLTRYGSLLSSKNFYWSSILIFIFSTVFYGFGTVFSIPRTVGVIHPIVFLIVILLMRKLISILPRLQLDALEFNSIRVMFFGAGDIARSLSRAFAGNRSIKIKGFVVDDKTLHGTFVDGIRLYSRDEMATLFDLGEFDFVALTPSDLDHDIKQSIIDFLIEKKIEVKVSSELNFNSRYSRPKSTFDALTIDDVLGRPPVEADFSLSRRIIKNKRVLVTGAGGSIGSEICRQIFSLEPKSIILLDSSEFNLFSILSSLQKFSKGSKLDIVPVLGSIENRHLLNQVFNNHSPDVIVHAAAYKHVDLVERNSLSAIRTNVFGTLNLAQIAHERKTSHFILISTDKAVRPSSFMGVTKRISELIVQLYASHPGDGKFLSVRFGNVLGSSGSVVPIFQQQIDEGGPVTVTHQKVMRYFMSIPEAAQLVLQAAAMSEGGETFVLEMGNPIKILDLAKRMIFLANKTEKNATSPSGDIAIKFTGLKKGEKLYEELFLDNEVVLTAHPRILKVYDKTEYQDKTKFETLERYVSLNDEKSAVQFAVGFLSDIEAKELEKSSF
ncbi:polysaccharide biosynthesis protein [Candidatus Puniceispirillum sp.]|nr:polysaccharide biosynthesis protein [Candidatus Puniceispirillum sp.]